jgi:hypothetical protein
MNVCVCMYTYVSKAVPLHAMVELRGRGDIAHTHFLPRPRPRFAPGKGPAVPIVQEAGWASEPVWTEVRGKILCPYRGSNPDRLVVQSAVRHYTA